MVWGLVGGILGGISSIWGASAAAKRQREQIKANRLAAKYKYSGMHDSVTIMKAAVREQTYNAVAEQLRADSATRRVVQQEIGKGAGSLAARSEGLASGRTKGRLMIDVFMRGNEALNQVTNKTTTALNKMIDIQDQKTNELNNRLIRSYQEMSAVLANPGPDLGNNMGGFISGVMGGVQQGIGIGAHF